MDEKDTPALKKYIRTFAGDMSVLQSGGTPALVPLVETKQPPKPSVAPSSVPEKTNPIPTPIPSSNVGHVSMSPLSIPIMKAETLKIEMPTVPESVSVPISEPVPEPIPIPKEVPEEPTPIETYASDFYDRIKEMHASPATVLAAEQDAAGTVSQDVQKSSRKNVLYVSAGAILILVSCAGIYFVYAQYMESFVPVILAPVTSAPIFIDDQEQVSGVGDVLLQAIERSVRSPLVSGTIRLLSDKDAEATNDSVFSALQTPAPNIILRNLKATNSIAGVINVSGKQSPFFILSVTSYSDTFSGMLSWESRMPDDLKVLFPAYQATTSTTTSRVSLRFRDEIINNHDARVYRDAEGRVILLYGYWNQSTLVIARDPAAFSEIVQRLANSRAQQ